MLLDSRRRVAYNKFSVEGLSATFTTALGLRSFFACAAPNILHLHTKGDTYYEKDVEPKNKKMEIGKYNNGNGKIGCQFAICLKDENILKTIASFDITSEEYDYIKDFAQKVAGDNVEILDDFVFPLNYLIKNFDDKTFDILMNAILSKQSTNQSSQDDLVR